jgi:hypothetical protein
MGSEKKVEEPSPQKVSIIEDKQASVISSKGPPATADANPTSPLS